MTVGLVRGRLVVEVADDGIGGADAARGTGLAGLADRVAALGGRLMVESPPGGGTRVRAELPDLAAQRHERARIRSERQQRWGRPNRDASAERPRSSKMDRG